MSWPSSPSRLAHLRSPARLSSLEPLCLEIRHAAPATPDDIPALLAIENRCFSSDRLSRRSFRHLLTRGNAMTLVEEDADRIRGYVLLLFSRGTSMARLYSIAVHPDFARCKIGDRLLEAAETVALERDCVSMRLEVRRDNPLR